MLGSRSVSEWLRNEEKSSARSGFIFDPLQLIFNKQLNMRACRRRLCQVFIRTTTRMHGHHPTLVATSRRAKLRNYLSTCCARNCAVRHFTYIKECRKSWQIASELQRQLIGGPTSHFRLPRLAVVHSRRHFEQPQKLRDRTHWAADLFHRIADAIC
jgi:hypothetical protein